MSGVIHIMAERNCGGCTACCDGWATGEAHGHQFYPGTKCHFVCETGCTIYEDRPEQPCKTFRCLWLRSLAIPAWMKPNLVNALLVLDTTKTGVSFVTIKEMGQRLDARVLNWAVQAIQRNALANVRYEIDGGWNFLGTKEFLEIMRGTTATAAPTNGKQL